MILTVYLHVISRLVWNSKGSFQLENVNLDCHCGINAEMCLRKQNALLAFIWYICKIPSFHLCDRDIMCTARALASLCADSAVPSQIKCCLTCVCGVLFVSGLTIFQL